MSAIFASRSFPSFCLSRARAQTTPDGVETVPNGIETTPNGLETIPNGEPSQGNGDVFLISLVTDTSALMRELKNEIQELPYEVFRKPKLARIRKRILLRKLRVVEKLIKRERYRPAIRIFERSTERRIQKWIVEPWRTDLIEKVDYIISNLP